MDLSERVKALFKESGGNNDWESTPLYFRTTDEKSTEEPSTLQEECSELFLDVAKETFGEQYKVSFVPYEGDSTRTPMVFHPVSMNVKKGKEASYCELMTFQYEGGNGLPLMYVRAFNLRKRSGWKEDATLVYLRFMYGSVENKRKLFGKFEEMIREAGIPYERVCAYKDLESVDVDIRFEEAESYRREI